METQVVTQHWAVAYARETGARAVYARGNIDLLDARPMVAIVGARAATAYGTHVAAEIASAAVSAGLQVVTDGAYGIGAAATQAVLAAGGRPLVWAAGGVDRAYPAGHVELFGRVLEAGGLLLSLQPDCEVPTRARFAERAHAIGTLADATVVVEAGARSGALEVARVAIEAGRRVASVPGPITSAASLGSNRLLSDPRVAMLGESAEVASLV